jgi:competence protein ComEA
MLLCVCCMLSARTHAQDSVETSASDSPAPGVVNLNTASAAELERLPRIGPSRAQAILALRAKLTRFSKIEQLLRVKGIGRATFRKLRPLLTLNGPTTLHDKQRAR